jgi:tetratricopeptide (TPR) repeat protein
MRGDPRSPELAVLDAQLRAAERASQEQINEAWSGAEATCPTPELFHSQASFWIDRNARGKAASALQTAINTFPENARLHRRLATIQLALGRYLDAVDTLKKARDLEPLMPDNYSALSEAYMNIGMDRWEEAAQCIEEALRLDPTHPFHLARAGSFLRRKAIVDTEGREAMLAQAEEHLRKALETEKGSPRILIELATIIIDRGGDLEQADWFLGQAQKRGESPEAMLQRARVLLRKKMYEESERILERLTRREPNLHGAYAVRGELWLERGQIFFGCEQLKTAVNRTGKHSPERVAYEAQIKLATALIESGQATELARQADESGHILPKPPSDGPRREPGKTTRRRKGKGGEAAPGAAPEGAEQAEASAEEVDAEEEGGEADEEGGQSGGLDWGSAPEPEDAGEGS